MSDIQLSTIRTVLLDVFRKLAASAISFKGLQQAIIDGMANKLPLYNWTGFYMLDPDDPENAF